jgi:hypothetical protein
MSPGLASSEWNDDASVNSNVNVVDLLVNGDPIEERLEQIYITLHRILKGLYLLKW